MRENYCYDKESDFLFIVIKEGEEESFEEIAPGINLEYNSKGEIIGIEILGLSKFISKEAKPETIKQKAFGRE